MTDTLTIPTLDRVTAVRLAISVEVWPDFPGTRDNPPHPDDVTAAIDRARRTVRDYLAPSAPPSTTTAPN